jgi:predicted alpha/beta-hydrolase family hydrolase
MASKKRKIIRIGLAAFWLCVMAWLFYNMQAHGVDDAMLQSNHRVEVQNGSDAIYFTPVPDTLKAGLIFYPGALVEPEAYAPMARAISEKGYSVILMKLPFRLAPLEWHRARVFSQTLEVIRGDSLGQRKWIVGGHSKGGKLAAIFSKEYADEMGGLLLVGTSHPREIDLSGLKIDVTKIYGSNDGLASEREVNEFAVNLPAHMHRVRVDGGNHRQFAWYGYQLGDSKAEITRREQQDILVDGILGQLERVQQN